MSEIRKELELREDIQSKIQMLNEDKKQTEDKIIRTVIDDGHIELLSVNWKRVRRYYR